MKYLILIYLSAFSTHVLSAQYIRVNFNPGGWFKVGDGCVESTRIVNAKGKNKDRCMLGVKKQSDGYGALRGDEVVWKSRGSKTFEIADYGDLFTSCDNNPSSEVTCTVSGNIATNQAYRYAIVSAFKNGGECILDPRIIVNDNH